ncbi:hypothetical protein ACIBH1_18835 [Nonomuraea sp. NPDC050663]|uniref:hypothetical protein n=1 Tax=Nonomuraea sp. NPDC050663 TaxID=3364370 RepID=UPI003787D84B
MISPLRLALAAVPVGAAIIVPGIALAEPPPLKVEFSDVNCRSNQVTVTITNMGSKRTEYTVLKDGERVDRGDPDTGETNKETVTVDPRDSARITVVSNNVEVAEEKVYNDCKRKPYHRDNHDWGYGRRLPYTGPPADLMGKLATGAGLLMVGGIAWWMSAIWPRETFRF